MPEIIHIDPNGDLIIHLGHDPTPTPAAQTPTNGAEQLQVQSPKAMSLFGGPSSGAPPALAAQTPTNGAEQPQVQSPKARSLFGGPSSGAAPAPASTATPQADLSNILPHLATVSASNPTGTPKIESAFAGVSTAATPSAPTGSLFQSLRVETKTLFPTTANNKQPVQLLVSLKHVTLACGRAKAVFGGRFRESKAEEDGLLHWRLGSHFEPEAVKMVMNVIHGYTKSLPDHVSLGRLTAIAAVVDDLACHDSVWFVAKSWICKLPAKPPATPIHDLPSWILVSFVFHEPELFTSATRLTIMHSSDPISAGELPIYPSIIAEMEKSKQSHLKKLIASLENLKGDAIGLLDSRDGLRRNSSLQTTVTTPSRTQRGFDNDGYSATPIAMCLYAGERAKQP
ncbi:hypothetical protein XA68_12352 [Ophiocordyceps unilateralis]|uniref:BTB domain-containing protein n=1 Tax=Ophiocordyceps unilateralis TaxID=268505 RepID=A0A2A9PQB6_OPHUN|nr:hypothetical protein XA68_12352 [Ophiocordyceps unilateralis]